MSQGAKLHRLDLPLVAQLSVTQFSWNRIYYIAFEQDIAIDFKSRFAH